MLCSLSAIADECLNPIAAVGVPEGRTGAPLRLDWFLGSVVPLSQTLTGHDFEAPVALAPHQRSYTYVPDTPGEKHATITVITECGTHSRTVKYHVQQCNVVAPA